MESAHNVFWHSKLCPFITLVSLLIFVLQSFDTTSYKQMLKSAEKPESHKQGYTPFLPL